MRRAYPSGLRWPAAVQSYLFQRHRAWLLPEMARRYGDVFSLRAPPYADNLVVFNRPEVSRDGAERSHAAASSHRIDGEQTDSRPGHRRLVLTEGNGCEHIDPVGAPAI